MSDITEKIAAKFRSGNAVPVERAVVLREEWEELIAHIRALESEVARREALDHESKRAIDKHNQQLAAENAALREANAALRAQIKRAEEQEPVAHQFQSSDGAWHDFMDRSHYENTVAWGRWPIRALYAAPIPAPVSVLAPKSVEGDRPLQRVRKSVQQRVRIRGAG